MDRTSQETTRGRTALVLQGGGPQGAFPWGVLDRLLEFCELTATATFPHVSGVSPGALNAVPPAQGWARDGAAGERRGRDAA